MIHFGMIAAARLGHRNGVVYDTRGSIYKDVCHGMISFVREYHVLCWISASVTFMHWSFMS